MVKKSSQTANIQTIVQTELPGIPKQNPMIIAHRGACGYLPEHTLAAYNLGLEMGADAVEPDIVPTADGVLLLRHENELSETTNIADFPEFKDRHTTKVVDGEKFTGWFAEDFTWEELQRLSARERIPSLRPFSASHNDAHGLLRLADLLDLLDEWQERVSRQLTIVIEAKHVRYFTELGFDIPALIAREYELAGWGAADADRIVYESFELSSLHAFAEAGLPGKRVFLIYDKGYPGDAGWGGTPKKKSLWFTGKRGLRMAAQIADGISVPKDLIAKKLTGRTPKYSSIVKDAAKYGLEVYIYTLRAENKFLMPCFSGKKSAEWGDWFAEFSFLMDSGVTAVFADQPDLAIAVRSAVRGEP